MKDEMVEGGGREGGKEKQRKGRKRERKQKREGGEGGIGESWPNLRCFFRQ